MCLWFLKPHRDVKSTLLFMQAARTEGLMARAELLTNALDELGHRLADAQSLAASQCEPVSLQEKVRFQWRLRTCADVV